jgi:hypothetical protein
MDLTRIKTAVLTQLKSVSGLNSLKIQNHLYGCFLLMEDIAEGRVGLSGTIVRRNKMVFDLNKQFGEIGLRYGFVLDTKLLLDIYDNEYKAAWLECFTNVGEAKQIGAVDNIEDCLIQVIQNNVRPEDAFFLNALETGSLPQEWVETVLVLLGISPVTVESDKICGNENGGDENENAGDETVIAVSAIADANTEKPINSKAHTNTKLHSHLRRLSTTRRKHSKTDTGITTKRQYSKTRRHAK